MLKGGGGWSGSGGPLLPFIKDGSGCWSPLVMNMGIKGIGDLVIALS